MVACRYGISLLVFNSTSHSFAALTRELSSETVEEKFHIFTRPCIILHLSHKLRCYIEISGTEKSGEEYEPTTLRGFIASVERHLKKQGYSDSIITGQPYAKTRDALKSKQKQLKRLGKGTNHERPLVSIKRRLIYFSRRESWEFIRLKHSLTRCGSTTVYTSE